MERWFIAGWMSAWGVDAAKTLYCEQWQVRTSYFKMRDGRVEHSFRTTTDFPDEHAVDTYLAYIQKDPHTAALVWHKPRWHVQSHCVANKTIY